MPRLEVIETPTPSGLNELAREIHANAVAHGWWDEERSAPEILMLCVSELSEALEEHRSGHEAEEVYFSCKCKDNGNCPSQSDPATVCESRDPKPEGIPIELADCIIRILDYCGHEGIDIDAAIRMKHEYNKTRPYRHGGKKC